MIETATAELTQQLSDRLAIEEVLARYCRGIDRCDAEELAAVFTEDAAIDFGDGPKSTGDTIASLMVGLGAMKLTQHNIGNVICRIHGDRAMAETYCVALHILPRGEAVGPGTVVPDIEMVVGGRYLDRLVKQGANWRIAERLYVMDWNRQSPATMEHSGGLYDTLARRGARAPDDPSFGWWKRGFEA